MVQHRLPMLPSAGEVPWIASVNGTEKKLNIENNAILLDVLRDQAGSLGTKRGCDMGTCGCCSVLIDGEPRLSCLTLAVEADGCKITTVEGLADGHHLHPIQEMFAECGGSQCGFCTPGFWLLLLLYWKITLVLTMRKLNLQSKEICADVLVINKL